MTKYKLRLDLKLELSFATLYRIERLSDGELGGFIESEKNLAHEGDAWVSGDSWVYGNARVFGDAWVSGDSWVYGNAQVFGNAVVYDDARVFGNAQVYGYARVFGNAQVYGDARVSDDAQVSGDAWVYGNARIKSVHELVNFVISFKFSITITPDNIVIGCQLKKRKEWLKVTKEEAVKMGLPAELYGHYKVLIKTGMKLVPCRAKLNRLEKEEK